MVATALRFDLRPNRHRTQRRFIGATMATKKRTKPIRSRVCILPAFLTREMALRFAVKRCPGDYRGFTYHPKTGRAVLT